MDVKAVQAELARFAAERGWDDSQTPKNLAMALAIEASVVLELFKWQREDARSASESARLRDSAADAIADVLLQALRLADRLDVDVDRAVADRLARNAAKYPLPATGEADGDPEIVVLEVGPEDAPGESAGAPAPSAPEAVHASAPTEFRGEPTPPASIAPPQESGVREAPTMARPASAEPRLRKAPAARAEASPAEVEVPPRGEPDAPTIVEAEAPLPRLESPAVEAEAPLPHAHEPARAQTASPPPANAEPERTDEHLSITPLSLPTQPPPVRAEAAPAADPYPNLDPDGALALAKAIAKKLDQARSRDPLLRELHDELETLKRSLYAPSVKKAWVAGSLKTVRGLLEQASFEPCGEEIDAAGHMAKVDRLLK
ncbi:MAG: hypothetical protein MUF79_00275 [Burkholderiales bacterium]|nr:hypothetical protein [Burkholderiales bacterium]